LRTANFGNAAILDCDFKERWSAKPPYAGKPHRGTVTWIGSLSKRKKNKKGASETRLEVFVG
jgi:hypothetical protein